LTFILISKVDDALKPEVIKWSAFYEHRIKLGSVCVSSSWISIWPISNTLQKVIFHLEAFVAKFMRIYEGYVIPSHLLSMSAKPADSLDRYLMGMDF
jgi:replication factor C subunit 3/5